MYYGGKYIMTCKAVGEVVVVCIMKIWMMVGKVWVIDGFMHGKEAVER
jgi:hypothetical protein